MHARPFSGLEPLPTRLLIVEADRRVRQGLVGLVALDARLTLVDAVADAEAAETCLDSTETDVALIDPHLPEFDAGLALLGRLRARWPEMTLVVMSCRDEDGPPALASGASCFVPKSGDPEALLATLLSDRPSDATTSEIPGP
jgi:DNA-binding NarL/FixJ family response regulator